MIKLEVDRRKLQELLRQSVTVLVQCVAVARKVISECTVTSTECSSALEDYRQHFKNCIESARATIKQCYVYDQEYDLLIEDEDLRACITELENCVKLLENALNACSKTVTRDCIKLSEQAIDQCEEGIDACKRLLNMRDDLA